MTPRGQRRRVAIADLKCGTTGLLAGTKGYWWELHLECGHIVERRIRYRKLEEGEPGKGAHYSRWHGRKRSDILPAVRSADCEHPDCRLS